MMNKKGPLAMRDIATNSLNLLRLTKVWLGACLLGVASLAAADLPPVDQVRLETGAKAKVIDTGGRTWVVMVQGWSGVMDEVGDLYARQASQLADRGISSIRMQIKERVLPCSKANPWIPPSLAGSLIAWRAIAG